MTVRSTEITCRDCGAVIDEPSDIPVGLRTPCSACGSSSRSVRITIEETLRFHESLGLKDFPPGSRKWRTRVWSGASLFRQTGKWHRLERRIDRANDLYYEHIEDKDTGEVIRHVAEPLSQHRGRGSAKNATKAETDNGAGDRT
jgi:hypothetical protein